MPDSGNNDTISLTKADLAEKLYEELFVTGEEYGRTAHEKIFVVKNASRFVSPSLHEQVQSLAAAPLLRSIYRRLKSNLLKKKA